MSCTARDLLCAPLPGINGDPVNPFSRQTNSTTYSTVHSQEPLLFSKYSPESWWELPLRLNTPPPDRGRYFEPFRERNMELQTEGDVDRAASVYLLHQVNWVLDTAILQPLAWHPDAYRCRSQYTFPRMSSQPDICFQAPGRDKFVRTFCIMDYKRR